MSGAHAERRIVMIALEAGGDHALLPRLKTRNEPVRYDKHQYKLRNSFEP